MPTHIKSLSRHNISDGSRFWNGGSAQTGLAALPHKNIQLVFIDEPFAKMDPTNVKIMLGFMKQQNLQMIFCAPDKTELIGNECEVVLPVLRTQPDLMEIGIIEMHKGV